MIAGMMASAAAQTTRPATGKTRPATASVSGNDDAVLCRILFEQYVMGSMVYTDERRAAVLLVARRGRCNGFWRVVLDELRQARPGEARERDLLAVVEEMLRTDGGDRWTLAHRGKFGQQRPPEVCLGPEVVQEVVARGMRADGRTLTACVRAAATAYDPTVRDFLNSVLQADETRADIETRFYAAVGLAELGSTTGMDWLVARAKNLPDGAAPHKPVRIDDRAVGMMSTRALIMLTTRTADPNAASMDWKAWWLKQRNEFVPAGRFVWAE
jgi:hypothetical protein